MPHSPSLYYKMQQFFILKFPWKILHILLFGSNKWVIFMVWLKYEWIFMFYIPKALRQSIYRKIYFSKWKILRGNLIYLRVDQTTFKYLAILHWRRNLISKKFSIKQRFCMLMIAIDFNWYNSFEAISYTFVPDDEYARTS